MTCPHTAGSPAAARWHVARRGLRSRRGTAGIAHPATEAEQRKAALVLAGLAISADAGVGGLREVLSMLGLTGDHQ